MPAPSSIVASVIDIIHLIISPVKTSVRPLSWPALLNLTLFTNVPLELEIVHQSAFELKIVVRYKTIVIE